MSRRLVLTAALVATLALAACGGADDGDDGDTPADGPADPTGAADGTDGASELSGELTVLAAASLNLVFEDIADLFTEQHPRTEVTFSFAGSSDLVAQLDAGAPAEVLATANEPTMADAVEGGTIDGEPEVFAENVLTFVTPAGNPADVSGLDASLAAAALVVCAPRVPCGAATVTLTENLGVTIAPVSEEGNVTDVLGKVTSGQADAGLVYTTDAVSAGEAVDIIPVDGAEDVVNRYPIAVTTEGAGSELAAEWVEFVLGTQAQEVLGSAGFGSP